MRFCIQVSKKDLGKLQELENVTGIGKSSIIALLVDEVYEGYKCAEMSKDVGFMPIALTTQKLKENIRR